MASVLTIEVRGTAFDRLERIPGALARARRLAAYRMAETWVNDTLDYIAAKKPFTPRSGQLEQSIDWRPDGDGAVAFAAAEYAPFVEHGTRPHVIRPRPGRQALRFFSDGRAVIRRKVNHPGTEPRPFFFADFEARKRSLLRAAREAVAQTLERG